MFPYCILLSLSSRVFPHEHNATDTTFDSLIASTSNKITSVFQSLPLLLLTTDESTLHQLPRCLIAYDR
eukprot:c11676_g1_i1 orf=49-255(-)